jgi:hypothetical protein
MLTKKEVQQRVLQNGKKLALSKFNWDAKVKSFSTRENNLVIDFKGITHCTFTTAWGCTFTTSWGCTFKTDSDCTFTTGWGCTFKTGAGCTFTTGWGCTFKTDWGCTFKTGEKSVIIRKDQYQVIESSEDITIKLCPCGIEGHLSKEKDSDKFYLNRDKSKGEHVIIDGILSKVISRKANVLKVINHGQTEQSYIVFDGDIAAHGDTIKEARESLLYKIGEIDISEFEGAEIDEQRPLKDVIRMYRAITGACAAGTRYYIESLDKVKKHYTIAEVASMTTGQYGNDSFKQFFNIK